MPIFVVHPSILAISKSPSILSTILVDINYVGCEGIGVEGRDVKWKHRDHDRQSMSYSHGFYEVFVARRGSPNFLQQYVDINMSPTKRCSWSGGQRAMKAGRQSPVMH